jgi:hypothetical protein
MSLSIASNEFSSYQEGYYHTDKHDPRRAYRQLQSTNRSPVRSPVCLKSVPIMVQVQQDAECDPAAAGTGGAPHHPVQPRRSGAHAALRSQPRLPPHPGAPSLI